MIIDIFKFYKDFQKNKRLPFINFLNYENTEYSAVIVICPNRSGILKDIVAGISNSQSNILGSRIISLNNDTVIDVFWICNSAQKAIKEKNEQKRLIDHLTSSITEIDNKEVANIYSSISKLDVSPMITIDNQMSKQVTTFQILSGDRQGLLMDILNIFHANNVSVQSAKISTYGEKVFDIFQITDLKNKKIKNSTILESLEAQLNKII